ncbi:hypothetical protein BU26DRAFT_557567 [Trematosphaeria pertusa]|uniref:Uncharacterized protein n=1 Tax=Trematosphaeria pertusa TaxID=390896 RepID=A0A6A6IZQ6_9PLEO|nr:uncharacterized protein BU26DRAFT_557567 [Trematosphaeria pertusa]KAF2256091.1 hypothetical protein BU26DRAFT_557567 [Trematosphaeria pertusa]
MRAYQLLPVSFLALAATFPIDVHDRDTAGGHILACKENSCGDCPGYGVAGDGYPHCVIYPTDGNLDGYPLVAVTGPVCQKVTLESTFMLQFCEAVDHAAITRSKKRSEEAVEE